MAGRKPKVLANPFIKYDNARVPYANILEDMSTADLDQRIEDILIGAVGAFKASSKDRKEYVKWQNVFFIYQQLNEITRQEIQDLLGISIAQAKRYAQVINLANVLIKNVYDTETVRYERYVHISHRQLKGGYLEIL